MEVIEEAEIELKKPNKTNKKPKKELGAQEAADFKAKIKKGTVSIDKNAKTDHKKAEISQAKKEGKVKPKTGETPSAEKNKVKNKGETKPESKPKLLHENELQMPLMVDKVNPDASKVQNLRDHHFEKENIKIELTHVTKRYDMIENKSVILKNLLRFQKKEVPSFWAVKGVSFIVKAGDSIGIVGVNGSGKSTLSNLIAGVLQPTTGEVKINGEASIISVSSGLNKGLSGIENIKLKLTMSGYSDDQIDDLMEDIIAFSELGTQIKQPLKSYSSGMQARLGFSIMIHMDPDVMIVDEALAVGDTAFKEKCEARIAEFKKQGKTFVLVSHNLREVEKMCEKAIWIHSGELKKFDNSTAVVIAYREFLHWYKSLDDEGRNEFAANDRLKRMDFDIDAYYQEELIKARSQTEKKRIKEVFYKNSLTNKMSLPVLILSMSLFILMILLIINQVQQVIIYWRNMVIP